MVKICFIGDSRIDDMNWAGQYHPDFVPSDPTVHFITQYGAGIEEANSTFLNRFSYIANNVNACVINLGGNDMSYESAATDYFPKYKKFIEDLAARFPNVKFYYSTICEVDSKYTTIDWKVKNSLFVQFNNLMKSNLSSNIKIIDSYAFHHSNGFTTRDDGIHFDQKTTLKLYHFILNSIKKDFPASFTYDTNGIPKYFNYFNQGQGLLNKKVDGSEIAGSDQWLYSDVKNYIINKFPSGQESVAIAGCGPSCISMVLNYFEGNYNYSPKYLNEYWLANKWMNGFNSSFMSIDGSGFVHDAGKQIWEKLHPEWKVELTNDHTKAFNAVKNKDIVMVLVGNATIPALPGSGRTQWTISGHLILMIGYNKSSGKVAVADPGAGWNDSYWCSNSRPEIDFETQIKAAVKPADVIYTIFRLPNNSSSNSASYDSDSATTRILDIKSINNGKPRNNPYGKLLGIKPSFANVNYYDCFVPYSLTCGELGGYVIKTIPNTDVGPWGPMSDTTKKMRVANYVNIEDEGESAPIQAAINAGTLKRYLDPELRCYVIERGQVKFFETAVQPFFLRRSVGTGNPSSTDGFFPYSNANRGQCLDVILTDGTCIHFILSDVNAADHTNCALMSHDNGDEYFAPTDYHQYHNIISGVGGNTLELRAKRGSDPNNPIDFGNYLFAKKFNLGTWGVNGTNDIAFYRMYDLNILTSNPVVTSVEAQNSFYSLSGTSSGSSASVITSASLSPSTYSSDVDGLSGIVIDSSKWKNATKLIRVGDFIRLKADRNSSGNIIWTDITSSPNGKTYTKSQLKQTFGIDYSNVHDGFIGRFELVQAPLPIELGGTGQKTLDAISSIIQGGINTITAGPYDSSSTDTSEGISAEELNRRLTYLFPNGIPNSEAEMKSYITSVTVPTIKYDGSKASVTLLVHKNLASSVREIFQEIYDNNIPILYSGSYQFRRMAAGALSHHSYGVGIDLNVPQNPQYAPVVTSKFLSVSTNALYNAPKTDPRWTEWNAYWNSYLALVHDGSPHALEKVVNGTSIKDIFLKHGWFWGGNWGIPWTDMMHFSWTDK